MRALARISFSGWLFILTIFSYLVWNPSKVSVWHMWSENLIDSMPAKLLISLFVIGILFFFFVESRKAIGDVGLFILSVIFGLIVWLFIELGILDAGNAGSLKYVAPFVCAIFLTVGSQFNKIRRSVSGTVVQHPVCQVTCHEHCTGDGSRSPAIAA